MSETSPSDAGPSDAAPTGTSPAGAGPTDTSNVGLPARRAALAALKSVDEDGAWSNLAVPEAIESLADQRDRSFAAHLAYDTLRFEGTLRWMLAQQLSRPIEDVEPALRRVLLLGALQLLRTGVPARAAVSTSAALAREQVPKRRADGAAGFVNGVLRGLSRGLEHLPWPTMADDPVRAMGLRTGHPDWIVADLRTRFDDARVAAVLAADDEPPGVTLRATADREALLAELLELGLDARLGSTPEAIRVPGADPRRLQAVAEGRAVVQDEASMEVVRATGVRAGDRVLDLCAGPGGKATHLAGLAGTTGQVTAIELHRHRAELIRQAAARQGLVIDVRVGDATAPPLPADATYDAVLLDAPCTGLGTGRRRPEVRWRRAPEDVASLAELQRRLLEAAADRVAPGGRLTYAVCTWTSGETTDVLDATRAHLDGLGFTATSTRQLLPDTDDTDGMFIATWAREADDATASPDDGAHASANVATGVGVDS